MMINDRQKTVRRMFCLFFLLLLVAFPVGAKRLSSPAVPCGAEDEAALCREYLQNAGWLVDPAPPLSETLTLPPVFNDVYERYNRLQLENGFDLSPFLGKRVTKYVFGIRGFPGDEKEDPVRATLFVYDGSIIGGDISSVKLDGFMYGLNQKKENYEPTATR